MKISVDEAIQAKRQLEQGILTLVQEFEAGVGLYVTNLEVTRFNPLSVSELSGKAIFVAAQVRLP